MRRRFSVTFLLCLSATAFTCTPARTTAQEPAAHPSRLHAEGEYLLWWVKGAPLPIPLVVTGPFQEEDRGVSPLATILYGGTPQKFPTFSGARLTIGSWLDDEQGFGVEGRGFLLERQTAGFMARSNAAGSPLLQVPFYNTQPAGEFAPSPGENGFPLALPGGLTGGVSITNSLRLWGSDLTGVVVVSSAPTWALSGLVGFKYLDLFESFDLHGDVTGLAAEFRGQSGALSDHFRTRNQFYGGAVGARALYQFGPLSVEASSRVALGASHQVLNVAGAFRAVNYKSTVGPEGIFAQPANSGRHAADNFAVVPEAQLKLGYSPAGWMRLTVGYDFLYDSSVVRPGDQLNRNLPKKQTFLQGGTDVSFTEPAPLFNRSSFVAHGVSFGLEFRY